MQYREYLGTSQKPQGSRVKTCYHHLDRDIARLSPKITAVRILWAQVVADNKLLWDYTSHYWEAMLSSLLDIFSCLAMSQDTLQLFPPQSKKHSRRAGIHISSPVFIVMPYLGSDGCLYSLLQFSTGALSDLPEFSAQRILDLTFKMTTVNLSAVPPPLSWAASCQDGWLDVGQS